MSLNLGRFHTIQALWSFSRMISATTLPWRLTQAQAAFSIASTFWVSSSPVSGSFSAIERRL